MTCSPAARHLALTRRPHSRGPADRIEREARAHLTALAFDLEPGKPAVEPLPDRRRRLRGAPRSLRTGALELGKSVARSFSAVYARPAQNAGNALTESGEARSTHQRDG
jgi:hypothetical protein